MQPSRIKLIMTTYSSPSASDLSRNAIEALAAEMAEHYGFNAGDELVPLVRKLGGEVDVVSLSDAEAAVSGAITVEGRGNFKIALAPHTGRVRDRFTIAHELGHYVLHYLLPNHKGNQTGPIRAQRFGTGRVEWEANWFAAALLMPADKFREEYKASGGDVVSIAGVFDVSIDAVRIRARVLGLE